MFMSIMRAWLTGYVRVAHAHSGTHSYAYVVVKDGSVEGNVQFPITDLNDVLDLALPADQQGALEAMRHHRDAIEGYAAQHLTLSSNGQQWALRFTGHRVLERKSYSYAIVDYVIDEPFDAPLRRVTITYDGIVHANPHHEALVIVRTTAGFGPLQHKDDITLTISSDETTHDVSLPGESTWANVVGAARYVEAQARRLVTRLRKRVARTVSGS